MISGTSNMVGNRMTREATRQARLAQRVEQTQVQVSTGSRLQKASDDPTAAAKVARIDRDRASVGTWQANARFAAGQVAQADTVLGTATALAARAHELMLAAASGTSSAADRQTAAAAIDDIAAEIASLSGTRGANDEPLFAVGNAAVVRFDANTQFAPLPARAAVFEISGTPIASLLANAANAARQGGGPAMGTALAELGGMVGHLADRHAALGLAGARLDRLSDSLGERDIGLAADRSGLADTDLAQAIAQLNAQQLTLEAAQAAFARINRQTLFDYLG